jgi:hypothetical protein
MSLRLKRVLILTYFAQATSLPAIHLCSLFILVKMTFLPKLDITYFFYYFHLFGVISHLESSSASFKD